MSEDDDGGKVIRLILRNPDAVGQVEDLSHIPRVFDKLFNKPYYAHQLRLAGYDWPQIARKLDYATAYSAEAAVHNWLRQTNADSSSLARSKEALRADAVQQELARLDKLQSAYWDEAVSGHIPSALLVLRVIAQRAKLLGLEATSAAVTNQVNTLVVGGDESAYVGALLRARDSLGPAQRVIEGDQPSVVD